MATIIQLRNDNKENWQNVNPILAEGEVGIELDTNKFKVGDGLTAWNDLPYMTSGSGSSNADLSIGSVNTTPHKMSMNLLHDVDIIFTVNGSTDEIRSQMNDKLITLYRNKSTKSPLHPTRMNEDRLPTDITFKCWCLNTGSPYEYYIEDNVYFYTSPDVNAETLEEMVSLDPPIFTVGDNYLSGIGTCLNVLTEPGLFFSDYYNDSLILTRLPEHDINCMVNWKRTKHKEPEGLVDIRVDTFNMRDYFTKMYCHQFKDSEGKNIYLWSSNWRKSSAVYACTDLHRIYDNPNELIEISDFTSDNVPYEHISERQDLRYLKYIDSGAYDSLISELSAFMNSWGGDEHSKYSLAYFGDYPVRPVPLSKCYMRTPVLREDSEKEWALKWVQVDKVEEWQWEKLNELDVIEFKVPYSAEYIAMRIFGVNKSGYGSSLNRLDKNYLPAISKSATYLKKLTGKKQKRRICADCVISEYIFFSIEGYPDINHHKVSKTNVVRKSLRIKMNQDYATAEENGEPILVKLSLV